MEKVAQNSPKTGGAIDQDSKEGAGLMPPTFQLKASASTTGVAAQLKTTSTLGTLHTLKDIANSIPAGVPVRSKVSSSQIMETDEWRILMDAKQKWQKDYMLTYGQALDVCNVILEKFVLGSKKTWDAEALDYIPKGLLVESKEEKSSRDKDNIKVVGFLRPVVAAFEKDVAAAKAVGDIRAAVEKHGPILWTTSVQETQKSKTAKKECDRPIYLARNEMRRILRNNALLGQPANLLEMQKLIQLLEDNSRGSRDLDGFKSADKALKRILITGFDPFGDPTNPSGIVAQRLDGQKAQYGDSDVAIIQSMTFPVRYDDFDKGMVERLVEPAINNKDYEISLVITISLDGGSQTMNLDKFSANARSGWGENEGVSHPIEAPLYMEVDMDGYITGKADLGSISPGLPKQQYQTMGDDVFKFVSENYGRMGTVPPIPMTKGTPAILAQPAVGGKPAVKGVPAVPPESAIQTQADLTKYLEGSIAPFYKEIYSNHFQPVGDAGPEFIESKMNLGAMLDDKTTDKNKKENKPSSLRVNQKFRSIDSGGKVKTQGKAQLAKDSTEMAGVDAPQAGEAAITGSGGDYLSNEIYHRVSTLTNKAGSSIKNVHIHIPPAKNKQNKSKFSEERIASEVKKIIGLAAHHN